MAVQTQKQPHVSLLPLGPLLGDGETKRDTADNRNDDELLEDKNKIEIKTGCCERNGNGATRDQGTSRRVCPLLGHYNQVL